MPRPKHRSLPHIDCFRAGWHAKQTFLLAREQLSSDCGLIIFHHQVQPSVQSVVHGDLAIVASENDPSHLALRQPVLFIQHKLDLHLLSSLRLDLRGILGLGFRQRTLNHRLVLLSALNTQAGLEKRQSSLRNQINNQLFILGRIRGDCCELARHLTGKIVQLVVPLADLLKPRAIDSRGPGDCPLGLDLLLLALDVGTRLGLEELQLLQLHHIEVLECLGFNLLGSIFGFRGDEIHHRLHLLRGISHGCGAEN
mmetsp:Transcript_23113/g.56180  ORF Transcript_23113/g.56180 Transcript_23113/m.56180 type:complete len:254 (-) Transcript_23113:43-804(-)